MRVPRSDLRVFKLCFSLNVNTVYPRLFLSYGQGILSIFSEASIKKELNDPRFAWRTPALSSCVRRITSHARSRQDAPGPPPRPGPRVYAPERALRGPQPIGPRAACPGPVGVSDAGGEPSGRLRPRPAAGPRLAAGAQDHGLALLAERAFCR